MKYRIITLFSALLIIGSLTVPTFASNSYAHNVYAVGSNAYSILTLDTAVYGYVYIEVQDKNGTVLVNNENYGTSTRLSTSANYSSYTTHYKARGVFHATIDGEYKTSSKTCYT